MLKSRRFWLGVVISAAFLALFIFRIQGDFGGLGRAFQEANYIFILPAILIYFVGVFFRAARWHYLLLPLGNFASYRLFSIVVIGFLVNNLVPGRLGILMRAYILGEKKKVSKVAVGATIGVERIFDGLVLVLFLVVISFFVSLPEEAEVIRWVAVGTFFGGLLGLVFITFRPDTTHKMGMVLIRRLPSKSNLKWNEWLDAAIIGLKVPRQPGRLFAVSATSLLVWLSEGATFYMFALCFHLGQPFHVMLLVMCIATLSWFILVVPAGLGPFHYFGQVSLIFFGVSAAAASAAISAIHAMMVLSIVALGLLFLWMEHITMAVVFGKRQRLAEKCEPGEGAE